MLSFLMIHQSLYLLLKIYIIDFSSLTIKNLNNKYISQIFLTEESIDKCNSVDLFINTPIFEIFYPY